MIKKTKTRNERILPFRDLLPQTQFSTSVAASTLLLFSMATGKDLAFVPTSGLPQAVASALLISSNIWSSDSNIPKRGQAKIAFVRFISRFSSDREQPSFQVQEKNFCSRFISSVLNFSILCSLKCRLWLFLHSACKIPKGLHPVTKFAFCLIDSWPMRQEEQRKTRYLVCLPVCFHVCMLLLFSHSFSTLATGDARASEDESQWWVLLGLSEELLMGFVLRKFFS